jgi:hypothetical protein
MWPPAALARHPDRKFGGTFQPGGLLVSLSPRLLGTQR